MTVINIDRPINYDYKNVHDDLENGIYSGAYGWDNAAYIGTQIFFILKTYL